ncbi:MAG: STAS domain-containing protein [Kiritimatiellae bacterium]|nr:STAS domain-containing protein [Kiritimatiellia bacterium]
MTITSRIDGPELTVSPKGRIDTLTAPQLEEALKTLPPEVNAVTFNFGEVDYISSAGLRVLLATQKRMKQAGGSMGITHVTPAVQEVFEITGFLGILTIR